MANNKRAMGAIRDFLLKMKALDTEIPEELAEDALEMTEEVKDALEEEELVEDEDIEEFAEDEEVEMLGEEEDELPEELEQKVEDALTRVLRKHGYIRDKAMSSLDELEEELVEDECSEETEDEVTEDPEIINAQDSARRLIRRVKPIIAGVQDARSRKILSDSFAKALKIQKSTADYAGIYGMTKNAAKDSKPQVNAQDLGSEWAKKYNPHYKEEK